MTDRTQETHIVKAALLKAGIPVLRVKHGTGTASGWLKIYLPATASHDLAHQACRIAQDTTQRYGPYDRAINVFTQG